MTSSSSLRKAARNALTLLDMLREDRGVGDVLPPGTRLLYGETAEALRAALAADEERDRLERAVVEAAQTEEVLWTAFLEVRDRHEGPWLEDWADALGDARLKWDDAHDDTIEAIRALCQHTAPPVQPGDGG